MDKITQIGAAIDASLKRSGVVLTAGGEPTFIAANHEHPEWNVAALGPTKLSYARRLAREIVRSIAPGAWISHTMGKQYPGEPIPRWAVNVHWRRDGRPLAPEGLFRFVKEPVHVPADARRFAEALAAALGLSPKLRPAYEDPSAFLKGLEEKAGHPLEPHFDFAKKEFVVPSLKAALRKELDAKVEPAGWVLPLDGGRDAWVSPEWPLRNPSEIILWPGESPLGLRLPLHRLPAGVSRCALTVEVRAGELSIFLPPIRSFDDYLDLFEKIEESARETGVGPIVLEGYEPPGGGFLTKMGFVADPGVLEVNLPPSPDQAGYARYVEALYKGAEAVGLIAHKYQYSGRKIGTGGGGHILLGGPSVDENPFFLRPKLLPSVIRYFQHHPSLSYFFTGLFVGPSSQAPRVDESTYEVPYELEIALKGVESMEIPVNRHLMDLMLRNLLMDTLGNTHRAEISIDKLWNPYAPNGCLGLVEFRAFEMPPRPEMLLSAVALLRGIAAMLVQDPFQHSLKRWGGQLHDLYALPRFLTEDLRAVLDDLRRHGFDFSFDLFRDWFEFRFPVIGTLDHEGRSIEFRQALEPWPVLGEQPGGGGTTRFVDASTDRIQVTIPDLEWARNYILLADGVPLSFVARPAEDAKIGAVRYRMFYCVPGLQPHITPYSPLRFELVDAATFRVVAARELRNWRPDQQSYDGLPRNDDEARRRVAERFRSSTETIGELRYLKKKPAPGDPLYTTDLRFPTGK